mmetsp:Transcript_58119/g.103703  ORF Transcript_58119/g.103703 Transcript_58119/m.103703 type:complete len:209 (-) Transcript_58119:750-1376(-)
MDHVLQISAQVLLASIRLPHASFMLHLWSPSSRPSCPSFTDSAESTLSRRMLNASDPCTSWYLWSRKTFRSVITYSTIRSQITVARPSSAIPAPRFTQSGMKENLPARPCTSTTNRRPKALVKVRRWSSKYLAWRKFHPGAILAQGLSSRRNSYLGRQRSKLWSRSQSQRMPTWMTAPVTAMESQVCAASRVMVPSWKTGQKGSVTSS